MLSDRDIRREFQLGALVIDPMPEDRQIQPVSIDLRLGEGFRRFLNVARPVSISRIPTGLTVEQSYGPDGLNLRPGEFILATTAERVTLPDYIAGHMEGKSTLGRLGLAVHATAGLIDPGFDGRITLEVSNVGNLILNLQAGDLIGQLTLDYLCTAAQRPYGSAGLGSHYQGQDATTPPRTSPVLRSWPL